MKRNTRFNVHYVSRAAIIAAMYVLLTIMFQPISFREMQFRVSEALTLLPLLMPEAIPGLFIGCLLANFLGGALWFDVVFGSLATLLAAFAVQRLRNRPFAAAAMPALFNGAIVGPVIYFGFLHSPGAAVNLPMLLTTAGSVALGEIAVCYTLGLILVKGLQRLPHGILKQ